MNDDTKKTVDCTAATATATGTSAVAVGAPMVPVKLAMAAVGGKGAVDAIAAKSAVVMGTAAGAAPAVFVGPAKYLMAKAVKKDVLLVEGLDM